jgi:hypothetical protein
MKNIYTTDFEHTFLRNNLKESLLIQNNLDNVRF